MVERGTTNTTQRKEKETSIFILHTTVPGDPILPAPT